MPEREIASIDLFWLPLGAGGHSVRLNGKVFEWVAAGLARRERCDLYHSALEVRVPSGRFIIEQAPASAEGTERGAVATGPVGARSLGRFRLFRYEVRRWRDGVIPDVDEAVASPIRLSDDPNPQAACSSSCPRCRRPPGAETSSTPARCGTRTRSSPGSSLAPGLTSTRSRCLRAGERRAGAPARRWHAAGSGYRLLSSASICLRSVAIRISSSTRPGPSSGARSSCL